MPSFMLLREISSQSVHFIRPSYRHGSAASSGSVDRDDVTVDGRSVPLAFHLQKSETSNRFYGYFSE